MEAILRTRLGLILMTAVAPAAWGTTYIVTEKFLPPDRPLFAALVRALPIGLVNPVVGTALGVAFAHEAFGPVQAIGVLLVLGSVVLGQRVSRPRAAPDAAHLQPAATMKG